MILGADAIRQGKKNGEIIIKPFYEGSLGPNSYDVKLAPELLRVWTNASRDGIHYTDPRLPAKVTYHTIPEDGLIIGPGELWLGSTMERAGSTNCVPMYDGRSTVARMGVGSHITAGFGDVGFTKTWTLEITTVQNFLLLPGMKIGQVFFHQITDLGKVYTDGHNYSEQDGPTPAKEGNI